MKDDFYDDDFNLDDMDYDVKPKTQNIAAKQPAVTKKEASKNLDDWDFDDNGNVFGEKKGNEQPPKVSQQVPKQQEKKKTLDDDIFDDFDLSKDVKRTGPTTTKPNQTVVKQNTKELQKDKPKKDVVDDWDFDDKPKVEPKKPAKVETDDYYDLEFEDEAPKQIKPAPATAQANLNANQNKPNVVNLPKKDVPKPANVVKKEKTQDFDEFDFDDFDGKSKSSKPKNDSTTINNNSKLTQNALQNPRAVDYSKPKKKDTQVSDFGGFSDFEDKNKRINQSQDGKNSKDQAKNLKRDSLDEDIDYGDFGDDFGKKSNVGPHKKAEKDQKKQMVSNKGNSPLMRPKPKNQDIKPIQAPQAKPQMKEVANQSAANNRGTLPPTGKSSRNNSIYESKKGNQMNKNSFRINTGKEGKKRDSLDVSYNPSVKGNIENKNLRRLNSSGSRHAKESNNSANSSRMTIPDTSSPDKYAKGFPTLFDLMKQNKSLHETLKQYNKKLSHMIDYKGFSKLVSKIKKGGSESEFKNRPITAKNRVLGKEVSNNEEVIKIKMVEAQRLENKKNRLLNPIYMTEVNREIISFEKEIKELRKEIHHLEIESKKEGKIVVRLNKKFEETEQAVHITSLINEIDLLVRANYEANSKIEDYEEQMREQESLIEKIDSKTQEVKTRMEKDGYVKETPVILEYKRTRAQVQQSERLLKMTQDKYNKQLVLKKRELEENQLTHDMLKERIENQDELISEQRQRLLDLIEIAKTNQSSHGIMILDRIKSGIETSTHADKQATQLSGFQLYRDIYLTGGRTPREEEYEESRKLEQQESPADRAREKKAADLARIQLSQRKDVQDSDQKLPKPKHDLESQRNKMKEEKLKESEANKKLGDAQAAAQKPFEMPKKKDSFDLDINEGMQNKIEATNTVNKKPDLFGHKEPSTDPFAAKNSSKNNHFGGPISGTNNKPDLTKEASKKEEDSKSQVREVLYSKPSVPDKKKEDDGWGFLTDNPIPPANPKAEIKVEPKAEPQQNNVSPQSQNIGIILGQNPTQEQPRQAISLATGPTRIAGPGGNMGPTGRMMGPGGISGPPKPVIGPTTMQRNNSIVIGGIQGNTQGTKPIQEIEEIQETKKTIPTKPNNPAQLKNDRDPFGSENAGLNQQPKKPAAKDPFGFEIEDDNDPFGAKKQPTKLQSKEEDPFGNDDPFADPKAAKKQENIPKKNDADDIFAQLALEEEKNKNKRKLNFGAEAGQKKATEDDPFGDDKKKKDESDSFEF